MAPAKSRKLSSKPLFDRYKPLQGTFDEFFASDAASREDVRRVIDLLDGLGVDEFKRRRAMADTEFFTRGVTFAVYSDSRGTEKIFPFDLIPRVVSPSDWQKVDDGLRQRVTALNAFLNDVYGKQKIIRDRVVPRYMIEGSRGYIPQMRGIRPRKGVYIVIAGIDLIRNPDGSFVVLEDNARTPSGVSYVLENRMAMKKVYPEIFRRARVRGVEEYPTRLRDALGELSPRPADRAHSVVLTPGPYNSAYFEHGFLARRMGTELVQGSDLFVEKDRVFARTTNGPVRVDVIYRRIDDPFIDPKVFRKDSMLGVPGLVEAYSKGNVALANAIGNGVADDKGIYPYVPDIIRYYLSEEPIIGQVPTYICARKQDRKYVLDNLEKLVVKAVNEAGGYGMLVGPSASRAECREFAKLIEASPRNYIAQPLIELSTCPTWTRTGLGPRRVDWRPYVVTGDSSWVLPGGLTRVALRRGSYVVNSSQGGGSKDTWVLEGGQA